MIEPANEPAVIAEMLQKSKTIAVVGMSDKASRPSHHIGKYLSNNGYRVLPVNPMLTTIDGEPCYPDLDAAQTAAKEQTGNGIDLVDVFRNSENVPPIVKDVIRLGIPYLWLQDDVVHEEAIGWAVAAGVKCVENDCIFRRHAQLRDAE
jgi:predicted CoA-binding protein